MDIGTPDSSTYQPILEAFVITLTESQLGATYLRMKCLSETKQVPFSHSCFSLFHQLQTNPSVSDDQNWLLSAIPTTAEIRGAVFSLKKSSSPGPSGFPVMFFTNFWHIVSADVIQAVAHFFSYGWLMWATNAYFLTLIPKNLPPLTSDFRPISLLNSHI